MHDVRLAFGPSFHQIQTPIPEASGIRDTNTLTAFLANVLALRGALKPVGHGVVSLENVRCCRDLNQIVASTGRRRPRKELTCALYFLYELFMPAGGREDKLKEQMFQIEEVYSLIRRAYETASARYATCRNLVRAEALNAALLLCR
jgi:hypothetical protein